MRTNPRSMDRNQKYRILALVLIGSGLLIVGAVTFVSLLKVNSLKSPSKNVNSLPAKVDFKAPNQQLQDINGQPASLSDYRGQILLVNNWATWCPPCRAEMPILEAYYRYHRDQGFVLIGINAGDPADSVEDFLVQHNLSFPVWLDPTNSALNGFRNNYLPSSYLIDHQGDVIMAWSGAVDREALETHITPMLKE